MMFLKTKIAGINPDKDLELAILEKDLMKENSWDEKYDPTLDPEYIAMEKRTISFVDGAIILDNVESYIFTEDGYINVVLSNPSGRRSLTIKHDRTEFENALLEIHKCYN